LSKRFSFFLLIFIFAGAFSFRFLFGLNCPALLPDEDEIQTYVIGLKAFTTHTWPYFGPDLQNGGATFNTQLPGALEGLLISSFLRIWANPVSPYFFINVLTFAALGFLAWYCHKRLPGFPSWFIFTWIYISIWTTHFSTQVINTSISLVGAILFFVGFMESLPSLGLGLLKGKWPFLLMGFGFFWVMQVHMTWVLFVPYVLFSFFNQAKSKKILSSISFFILGSIPMLALIIPTYIHYGFRTAHDLNGSACVVNMKCVKSLFDVLGRYFSFSCFELPRFIGEHTPQRLSYLLGDPLITIPGFFLWLAGILQGLVMLFMWFKKDHPRGDWKQIKILSISVFLILYLSFWFSVREPFAYRIYESLPISMIYSFYCWDFLSRYKPMRILGTLFIICALYFQSIYIYKEHLKKESVFYQCNEKVANALKANDFRLLADRRPGTLY